jgi:LmbE family N-acetylglucosaminyl deacetylase
MKPVISRWTVDALKFLRGQAKRLRTGASPHPASVASRPAPRRGSRPRVILAVFAHPDDEAFVGPVLARYAREGTKVYLAIATKGEKWAREPTLRGEPLAKVRREEASCACRQLGIEPPIFFELNDGELGAITRPLGHNVQAVADQVEKLIGRFNPEVVVTWGPEGGYGHPDHRLVSDAVTQVIQSARPSVNLVYAGFAPKQVKTLNRAWPTDIPWHATDPSYLAVRVPFTKADQLVYHRAFECHKSQYTGEQFEKLEKALDSAWAGSVWFRRWLGIRESNDLFD